MAGGAFRCAANSTTMAGVRVVPPALLDGGDSGHGGARGNLPTPAASPAAPTVAPSSAAAALAAATLTIRTVTTL